MPKMQVYLPAELYKKVKRRGKSMNVSKILQRALEEDLAAAERQKALEESIRDYEAEFGKITPEEAKRQWDLDGQRAIRPMSRRGARAKARGRRRKAA